VIFFYFLHNKDYHTEMRQVLKDANNNKVNFLYLQHQNQWKIHFIHQKEGHKMPHWIVRILYGTHRIKWWVTVLYVSYHRCVTRINIAKSKTSFYCEIHLNQCLRKQFLFSGWNRYLQSQQVLPFKCISQNTCFIHMLKGSFILWWTTRKC